MRKYWLSHVCVNRGTRPNADTEGKTRGAAGENRRHILEGEQTTRKRLSDFGPLQPAHRLDSYLYICGAERREVKRGDRTKNLRGWIQTLVEVPDEEAIVRRIFSLYVDQDKSLCAIARLLNAEHVLGPGRGVDAVWTVQNVRKRLKTTAYVRPAQQDRRKAPALPQGAQPA
jgi:Recombinase